MPHAAPDRPAAVRFGPFELDLRSGELSASGLRTRLQDQPFEILRRLVERPGELVTRDELRERLWPNGTIVDFEHGVNTALKRLRDALGDAADSPRYVETIPRRGYRFIAPVEVVVTDGRQEDVDRAGDSPAERRQPETFVPVGHYRILEKIGAGAMGEVYRAEDVALKRQVALKFLPEEFVGDASRLLRFQREAEALAALNHPNIEAIYGVGDAEGRRCLVLELVEGESLTRRIARGPLPAADALKVVGQVADALAAAHRKGIIHRDLKPDNVQIRRDGRVKVLDFGLARMLSMHEPAGSGPGSAVPHSGSQAGVVLGTASYMSPEQAAGKPVDHRTDVWALGCVLFECLAGNRAFHGKTGEETLEAVRDAEPDWTALPNRTPSRLTTLLERCLQKDPDERWQDAHDLADELRWIAAARNGNGDAARARRWRMPAALVASGMLIAAAAGGTAMWRLRPHVPPPQVSRLSLDVRPAEEVNAGGALLQQMSTPGGSYTAFSWTPDGQALVLIGRRAGVRQLWVRRRDAREAQPLAGTEGAGVLAVSVDGQWVAFWARGSIKRVHLLGGPVVDLAPGIARRPWGLSVDANGSVLFGKDDGRIWQIAPDGVAAAVTTLGQAELAHVLPHALPGGQAFLFTVRKREWTWGDEEVVAQSTGGGAPKLLLKDAADARYVPPGYLVFLRRGQLFAVPFDAGRLEIRGAAVPVLDSVVQALVGVPTYDVTGAGQFAVSTTGTLAWLQGTVARFRQTSLVTADRRGKIAPLPAPVGSYSPVVRLSPDGRRLAVSIHGLTDVGMWTYDLARRSLIPIRVEGECSWPAWSPDGKRLAFGMLKDGRRALVWQSADDTAPADEMAQGPLWPSSWTRDGRQLALAVGDTGDMALASIDNGRALVQNLLQTSRSERAPTFSPDGLWLAYESNDSGRFEVFIRPYPSLSPVEQVSIDGGISPSWNPNGRELFFLSPFTPAGKRSMMAVEFEAGVPPRIGRARQLFEFDSGVLKMACGPLRCYDVAPDGQRFYVTKLETQTPVPVVTHINLVENWIEEVKAKVPVTKK